MKTERNRSSKKKYFCWGHLTASCVNEPFKKTKGLFLRARWRARLILFFLRLLKNFFSSVVKESLWTSTSTSRVVGKTREWKPVRFTLRTPKESCGIRESLIRQRIFDSLCLVCRRHTYGCLNLFLTGRRSVQKQPLGSCRTPTFHEDLWPIEKWGQPSIAGLNQKA